MSSRPHVHDAVEPELGADGGGGDAVLAGAGLGDDPPLAHPPREEHLPDRVVDLVRAGVAEVLALEVDLRPAELLRQPVRERQRRRPADVVAQQVGHVALEVGVGLRLGIRRFQLGQHGNQDLGHERAAVGAEPSTLVGGGVGFG